MNKLFSEIFCLGIGNLSFLEGHFTKLQGALFILCTGSGAEIRLNTRDFAIRQGDLLLALPGDIIGLKRSESGFTAKYIALSESAMTETAHHITADFFRFRQINPIFKTDYADMDFISHWWELATALVNEGENNYRDAMAINLLKILFWRIAGKTKAPDKAVNQKSRRRQVLFHKFMTLIAAHCHERRDVEFYASKMCITPRYLSMICTDEGNGRSAKKIIDENIVIVIKTMLEDSDSTLQEIAEQLHFPDQSDLARYFRKHTGISPLKYRKTIYEKSNL